MTLVKKVWLKVRFSLIIAQISKRIKKRRKKKALVLVHCIIEVLQNQGESDLTLSQFLQKGRVRKRGITEEGEVLHHLPVENIRKGMKRNTNLIVTTDTTDTKDMTDTIEIAQDIMTKMSKNIDVGANILKKRKKLTGVLMKTEIVNIESIEEIEVIVTKEEDTEVEAVKEMNENKVNTSIKKDTD